MRNLIAAIAALSPLVLGLNARAEISSVQNRLISLTEDQSAQTDFARATPEEVARQFLKQNAEKLGIPRELNDLVFEAIVRTPVGYHVHFQQVENKMPVYAANIVVTLDRRRRVVTYVNSYQKIRDGETISVPKIRNIEAVNAAYSFLGLHASPRRQQVLPMVLVKDGVPTVIYRIRLSAPIDKKWSWEILTDAQTNRVIDAKDIAMHDGVTTTIFLPNPTIRTGMVYGQAPGFNDNDNADNDFFKKNLTTVELLDMNESNGVYDMTGKYVQIVDTESPKNPDCKTSNPDMAYTRGKPCFDTMMVYYFIDYAMRYLNEELGVQALPFQYQGGVKADPHGLDGADNSHYDPSSGELAFGEGGIDDAQDHDVILHELGHGIHDWVTHGHLSQVEGLSEGSGDYWALSYSRMFMKPNHVAWNWTFSFDGHNEFWPGRIANVSGNYPTATQGEIHDAGQLWATVCMLVRDKLGKKKTDKIFWSALAMLNETSGQADAANAFVKATEVLSPAKRATVVSIFQSKGYPVQ